MRRSEREKSQSGSRRMRPTCRSDCAEMQGTAVKLCKLSQSQALRWLEMVPPTDTVASLLEVVFCTLGTQDCKCKSLASQ